MDMEIVHPHEPRRLSVEEMGAVRRFPREYRYFCERKSVAESPDYMLARYILKQVIDSVADRCE